MGNKLEYIDRSKMGKKRWNGKRFNKRKKRRGVNGWIILLISIILLVSAGAWYFYIEKVKPNQEKVAKKQEDTKQQKEKERKVVEDPLEAKVKEMIAGMSVEEKVAQLFLIKPETLTGIGIAVQAGEATKASLEQHPVGGFLYAAQNIEDEVQLKTMLVNTKSYNKYPMFLGIDATQITNETIRTNMEAYGFNVNMESVMEASAIKNQQDKKIRSVARNFPSVTDYEATIESGITSSMKTIEELQASELQSYEAAMKAGVEFIMVEHTTFPNIAEDGAPADLSSKVVTDLLRTTLNYKGIIITDALDSQLIITVYEPGDAAVRAIQAGCDMILMPADFSAAYQAVLMAVQSNTISIARVEESLTRILQIKLK